MSQSKLYVATFEGGAVAEKFYALDDEHATAVAKEVAARRRLVFDDVKVLDPDAVEPADCAPWAYPRCTR